MTIGEANAVNVTLNKFIRNAEDIGAPVPADVVDACALLADKAHSALFAGFDGKQVRDRLGALV